LSDIPEYQALQEKQKKVALSSLSADEKTQRFAELRREQMQFLYQNNDVDMQEFYFESEGFQKKYMITRFDAGNYTFPDFAEPFMYHTSYVIVPYYQ